MTVASWHHCFPCNTTSARLSALWAQQMRADVWRRPLPHEKTRSIQNFRRIERVSDVRIIAIRVHVSHHNPVQPLQPIFDGRTRQNAATVGNKTDSKGKDKPKHTISYCRRKLDSSALSDNSQPNTATSKTRDSDFWSDLTEITRRSDMQEPPYTVLHRVRIPARADCSRAAQTSTARSSAPRAPFR